MTVLTLFAALTVVASGSTLPAPAGRGLEAPVDTTDAVFVRVLDVGQGLTTIVEIPGGHVLVIDAGDSGGGRRTIEGVRQLLSPRTKIDLLVLSHPDRDHISGADELLREYPVRRVLRTGYQEPDTSDTWREVDAIVRGLAEAGETVDVNLQHVDVPPGSTYRFGEAFVTVLSGHARPPESWGLTSKSERVNAVSLVVWLTYRGGSVLFTGDAVGRDEPVTAPSELRERMVQAPTASERYLLDFASVLPLRSDVLIAPHHGADNASSAEFIAAVDPEWVVLSAGTHGVYRHPRQVVADRYRAAGVAPWQILRTDADDRDEGEDEWTRSPDRSAVVEGGDVEVVILGSGHVMARYAPRRGE